jgi:DNA processing protein
VLRRSQRPLSDLNADLLTGLAPRELLARELSEREGQLVLGADDLSAAIEQAEAEVDRWQRAGRLLVTVLDPGYPRNLHLVHDRPLLLFVAGSLVAQDDRAVAVIGTRSASLQGMADARLISQELGRRGFTLVSGLARGIDTAVHGAALDAGQRTIAVIGTGLDRAYPRENQPLQEQISRLGAVVSCFWPEDPPKPEAFRRRNAVMSGLALGTVIVEAGERSGARVQARRALEHGRPVFLWRALRRAAWAQHLSDQPGVYVIDQVGEIVDAIERTWPAIARTD